jgi:hypothetical protein
MLCLPQSSQPRPRWKRWPKPSEVGGRKNAIGTGGHSRISKHGLSVASVLTRWRLGLAPLIKSEIGIVCRAGDIPRVAVKVTSFPGPAMAARSPA